MRVYDWVERRARVRIRKREGKDDITFDG